MVAYSFRAGFAKQVETGFKAQTVRALGRKRHARVGEPVQIYTGMRTKYCRKLLDPDPICASVKHIEIKVSDLGEITKIVINAIPLSLAEREDFAISDGFDPLFYSPDLFSKKQAECNAALPYQARRAVALEQMSFFWANEHGQGRFEGVLIEWRRADG
ncbi:MAG: hypothetical protein ACPGOY_07040 [Rhodospirillaceae bacterium]